MGVTLQSSGKYRVQIRRKNVQLDAVFSTEAEAKEAEAKALSRQSRAGSLTLDRLWEMYVGSTQCGDKSEQTRATERSRIKPVLAQLGKYALGELESNTSIIYEYIDARRKVISSRTGKRLSNSSVRLEIAALSAVVEFAKRRQIIRANFVTGISRPATAKRKRRVSSREQGQLQICARNSDLRFAQIARFLMVIRHLGCRPGELKSLRVSSVNLERCELTFFDTKNGKDRCVHVTSDAAQLLHLQLNDVQKDCPYVFGSWSSSGKKWVPYNYASGVNLLREYGIIDKDYAAHAGRREFISRAIESNMSYGTIKKQTGHQSTQALEIYDEGLSTAPEIRAELDRLAEKVQGENLLGTLDALGLTPELQQKFGHVLGLKDSWVNPFDEKSNKISEKR
ncbi:tyrosine-type recombinase/integrase [Comamonas aquatica]|uniref:tyrosine-type recombinase/integrase n=1 Tax=Comamonas aquatica TaxID=225991 RepID=UPI00320A4B47